MKIINKLTVVLGKGARSVPTLMKSTWEKSMFWKLPYWMLFHVQHTLDGMHITKKCHGELVGYFNAIEGQGERFTSMSYGLRSYGCEGGAASLNTT